MKIPLKQYVIPSPMGSAQKLSKRTNSIDDFTAFLQKTEKEIEQNIAGDHQSLNAARDNNGQLEVVQETNEFAQQDGSPSNHQIDVRMQRLLFGLRKEIIGKIDQKLE